MYAYFITLIYLIVPMIPAGALFLSFAKLKFLPILGTPINEKLFGKNKTYRGFTVLPLLVGIFISLMTLLEPLFGDALLYRYSEVNPMLFGIIVGLGFAVSELPNSYFKRKLGIAPGKQPDKHKLLFIFLDSFDAAPLVILIYWLFFHVTFSFVAFSIGLSILIKIGMNNLLFILGIRKNRF
ncbi:MAG: hypothetical protein A2X86_03110 [Bdellovibrionales bacterium GWA2_49_15]|nr:MAG: hypothetical protein A2X86_03110 [Bdellovibrionales bacterium GWA2_49_15]HAZ12203.1 hypothetical protein [Bdellovibrionales bacterium]